MGLKDLFMIGKVLVKTAKKVREDRIDAADLAQRPMPEVLDAWVTSMNRFPELWSATPRAPATTDQVAQAERRLGAPLPDEVRAFYATCNGLDAKAGSSPFPHPLLGVTALVPCGLHRPPLSAQCEAQWEEWGKEQEEPRALRIFPNHMRNILADEDEGEMQFKDADRIVALTVPREGVCIGFAIDGSLGYPAGTIFHIENLLATRFDNLRQWLAFNATALSGDA